MVQRAAEHGALRRENRTLKAQLSGHLLHPGHGGQEPGDEGDRLHRRAHRPVRRAGAHRGGERHRQGRAGADHPRPLRPGQGAVSRAQHERHPGEPGRERALRPREGSLLRRRPGPAGLLRRGRRGHALPRRDRPPARHAPAQAAPGPAGRRVHPGGQPQAAEGQRPGGRGHQRKSEEGGPGGEVPRGPLVPAPRRPHAAAAAAGAARGHPAARRAPGAEARGPPLPAPAHARRRGDAGAPRPLLAGQHPGARARAGAGAARWPAAITSPSATSRPRSRRAPPRSPARGATAPHATPGNGSTSRTCCGRPGARWARPPSSPGCTAPRSTRSWRAWAWWRPGRTRTRREEARDPGGGSHLAARRAGGGGGAARERGGRSARPRRDRDRSSRPAPRRPSRRPRPAPPPRRRFRVRGASSSRARP